MKLWRKIAAYWFEAAASSADDIAKALRRAPKKTPTPATKPEWYARSVERPTPPR